MGAWTGPPKSCPPRDVTREFACPGDGERGAEPARRARAGPARRPRPLRLAHRRLRHTRALSSAHPHHVATVTGRAGRAAPGCLCLWKDKGRREGGPAVTRIDTIWHTLEPSRLVDTPFLSSLHYCLNTYHLEVPSGAISTSRYTISQFYALLFKSAIKKTALRKERLIMFCLAICRKVVVFANYDEFSTPLMLSGHDAPSSCDLALCQTLQMLIQGSEVSLHSSASKNTSLAPCATTTSTTVFRIEYDPSRPLPIPAPPPRRHYSVFWRSIAQRIFHKRAEEAIMSARALSPKLRVLQ